MATPIIELIAQNLLAALQEIVTAGAAAAAIRPLRAGLAQAPEDKLLVLYQGDDVEQVGEEAVQRFKTWIAPFSVYCYVRPSDDSATAVDTSINTLRADVEKKLREAPTRGGYALDTRIGDPEGFIATGGSEGVIVSVDVLYRHLEDDPYAQS